MASSLLEVAAGSKWSSEACKLDGRNGLSKSTAEVNLGLVELFWPAIAFYLPFLYIRVILSNISTNAAERPLYKSDPRGISSKFFEKY